MEFKNIKGEEIKKPKGKRMSWRPSVYGFLVKNKSILCVRTCWDKKYSLPGGAVEFGESIRGALKREFLEETGYRIEIIGDQPIYFKNTLFLGPVSKRYFQGLVFFYKIKIKQGSLKKKICSKNEVKELCWKKISEIKLKDFTPFQRDFLKSVLKKYGH